MVYMTINHLFINNNGGRALAGTLALLSLILVLIFTLIEQTIVKNTKFKTKYIWAIEILIILLIAYLFRNGFSIG